jgi:uncharacterized small protein (DUF1192 family)
MNLSSWTTVSLTVRDATMRSPIASACRIPMARSLEDLLTGGAVAGASPRRAVGRSSRTFQSAVAIGPDREKVMDWDDLKPKAPKGITLGESLESLSVAELDARIVSLEQEIERVKAELAQKKAHETAAAAIFKR